MDFKTKPYDFQIEDFEKYKDDAYLALLFEMGLGKSKLTIDFIRYKNMKHKTVFPTLIIAPNIALYNWQREFYKHSELGDYVEVLQGTKKQRLQKLQDKSKKIFVINFEGLYIIEKELLQYGFVIMVMDESQRCFPYDTLIDTDQGLIPIGDIVELNINCLVRSYNLETSRVELKEIKHKFKNVRQDKLVEITHEKGKLCCTKNHKIYTPTKVIEAGKLSVKDELELLLPNDTLTLTKINDITSIETTETRGYVYNLEIADNHNYFANNILVSNCKNISARRTKAAIHLGNTAKCKYILSGTPILNSPMDIFAQYWFLDGGKTFGTNFWAFKNRYFEDRYLIETNLLKHEMTMAYRIGDTKTAAGLEVRIRKREEGKFPVWEPKPGVIDVLHNKILKLASIRKQKDCLPYLPPKVYQQFDIELSKEQKKAYKEIQKFYITFMEEDPVTASNALCRDMRFCQIVSGFIRTENGVDVLFDKNPKLDALKELLEDITIEHKVIIWAVYRSNIEMLVRELKEYNPVHIYGGVKDKETPQEVFNNDPKCRVFIGNPESCGLAINLIAADYAIRYSYNYKLEPWIQAEARCFRSGSEIHEKITYIDLVAEGTIDEKVVNAIKNKEDIANCVLTGFKEKEVA